MKSPIALFALAGVACAASGQVVISEVWENPPGDGDVFDPSLEYIELYASTLKINARRVEEAFQKRFQYLPLGTRLWRHPDMGCKYDQPQDAGKVHKVFLTFSPLVAKARRDLWIKLNP